MSDTDLTSDQLDALERELRQAKGRSRAVSSSELAEKFVPSDSSGNPKTREAIKHLMRERGLPVIGGGQGYFIPRTNAEISENVQSLQERINGIKERQRLLVDNWAAHNGMATDGGQQTERFDPETATEAEFYDRLTDEEQSFVDENATFSAEGMWRHHHGD